MLKEIRVASSEGKICGLFSFLNYERVLTRVGPQNEAFGLKKERGKHYKY